MDLCGVWTIQNFILQIHQLNNHLFTILITIKEQYQIKNNLQN